MGTLIQRFFTSIVLIASFGGCFFLLPPIFLSAALLMILCIILCFEWPRFFSPRKPAFWIIAPFYPVAPFIFLIYLNQAPQFQPLLFILFMMVASFDSGSYLCGTQWGTHRIAPSISPGKTWEGATGGYVLACISLMLLEWLFLKKSLSILYAISISFLICASALAGDLLESWLKRRAGIKDSGTFLPGHGGFLDRFDGVLFVVFFFFLFRQQLSRLFF